MKNICIFVFFFWYSPMKHTWGAKLGIVENQNVGSRCAWLYRKQKIEWLVQAPLQPRLDQFLSIALWYLLVLRCLFWEGRKMSWKYGEIWRCFLYLMLRIVTKPNGYFGITWEDCFLSCFRFYCFDQWVVDIVDWNRQIIKPVFWYERHQEDTLREPQMNLLILQRQNVSREQVLCLAIALQVLGQVVFGVYLHHLNSDWFHSFFRFQRADILRKQTTTSKLNKSTIPNDCFVLRKKKGLFR